MLTYSLAAYRNEYSNLQLRAGVPTGGAMITNAAEALIKGFEAEVTVRASDATRIMRTSPHGREIHQLPDRARYARSSGGCFGKHPAPDAALAVLRLRRAGHPAGPVHADGGATIAGATRSISSSPTRTPSREDPAGSQLGAKLTARAHGKPWSVSVFGTNLTNERIINTAAVTFSYPQVELNKPRVSGRSLQLDF